MLAGEYLSEVWDPCTLSNSARHTQPPLRCDFSMPHLFLAEGGPYIKICMKSIARNLLRDIK